MNTHSEIQKHKKWIEDFAQMKTNDLLPKFKEKEKQKTISELSKTSSPYNHIYIRGKCNEKQINGTFEITDDNKFVNMGGTWVTLDSINNRKRSSIFLGERQGNELFIKNKEKRNSE